MANKLIARKLHWTQTKAGKAKLKKSHAKAWKTRQHNAVMKTDEEFPDDDELEEKFELRRKAEENRRSKTKYAGYAVHHPSHPDRNRRSNASEISGTRKSVGEDNTADSDEFLDEIMDRAEFQQAFPEVLASALGWDVIATDPKRKVIIISVQLE